MGARMPRAKRVAPSKRLSETELQQELTRLRREARKEIERLIDLLDKSDPYFDELEPTVDDGPIDDLEEEPDHASTEMEDSYPDLQKPTDRWTLGREGPEDDLEPSLGSINPTDGPQPFWAVGLSDDTEYEHNGAEPDEDSEHSLGSLNLIDQRRWNEGDGARSREGHDPEVQPQGHRAAITPQASAGFGGDCYLRTRWYDLIGSARRVLPSFFLSD